MVLLELHRVNDVLLPALAAACSDTATVAVALAQGATPATVYVYTPGSMVEGSYIPPATGLGPLHAPPTAGLPVSALARFDAAPFAHSVSVPLPPATGAACSDTVTVAVALAQGATPATVYVYTPGSMVEGSYIPPVTGLGPLHAPP
ncbi:MAG: hypothetical protein JSS84_10250, partial [Bacteroidetes bacterium]|nr:hypothetical protein [Bacteroidota bacterium]